MKTLEAITEQLEDPKDLHTASMLAFVEAAQSVVNRTTLPTPLYRLTYDVTNNNVDFDLLEGRARVPQEGALDVNMLKLMLGTMLREKLPLLFEGKTGVGKTYTVEQLFQTMLPSSHYKGLRLNSNMTNVLQPFVEGRIEDGLLCRYLRPDVLESVGAMFVDEKNRGETNQLLMLQDGKITLDSGERGTLGLQVPQYKEGKWQYDPEFRRPMFLVSAQNPPATKDAKYNDTRRADAAAGNRDLLIDTPNTASTVGASTLLIDDQNGHHALFKEVFGKVLGDYLGIEIDMDQVDDQEWLDMYAFTTDPRRTNCPNIQSSVEFFDAMLCMLSPDLKAAFEADQQDSIDWDMQLKQYKNDITYPATIDETTQQLQKVRAIVTSFKEEFIPRDNTKVKKLADTISLVRRLDQAISSENPLETFRQSRHYVTVQDFASAFAVSLYDKQETHEQDPVTLIDAVLKAYVGIVNDFAESVKYNKQFSADDPLMSVYNLALFRATQTAAADKSFVDRAKAAVTGPDAYPQVKTIVEELAGSVATLKRRAGGDEYRKPLISRMIADLNTLAGFVDHYKDELEPALAAEESDMGKRNVLKDFYTARKLTGSIPDIYLQRLPRVLNV